MNAIGHNTAAGRQLRSFIERIEYMNEQLAKLMADRTEIFLEAKGLGFCTKTMREIVRLRRMSETERQEAEALLDLYKGALGMLEGTPLGDAARKRMMNPPAHDPETGEILDTPPAAGEPEPLPLEGEEAETLDEAREKGREAAIAGSTVIDNPYPAGDRRRAAWDEGWCEEQGSDGMGIPAAWRRSKPKPTETSQPGANGGGQ